MRFVEYNSHNNPRLGVIENGLVLDVAGLNPELPARMLPFIQAGSPPRRLIEQTLASEGRRVVAGRLEEVPLGPPIPNPPKLICVAGNYREHLEECGIAAPDADKIITPQLFSKFPSTCIIGPGAPIPIGHRNVAVDWEIELAVVIGTGGKNIPSESALEHVFGYTIINDVSERKFNSNIPNRLVRTSDNFFDWLSGKWFDGFAPVGPALVTRDEIPDPQALQIGLEVNGVVMQDSFTSKMIFSVAQLIAYISAYVTLEPGDMIATGTPEGVGVSRGMFLKSGDVVRGWISGIGSLENRVVALTS
jgi:2-keto-4-pentenoate hydratase/2-oxohepta-3-ene-1,7-dioic acid hydratase in catechol pathway